MDKNTTLQRLGVLRGLIENLPDGITFYCAVDYPRDRVSVTVYRYFPELGIEYESGGIKYNNHTEKFYEERFYKVGEVEINGCTLPVGYELRHDVEVEVSVK